MSPPPLPEIFGNYALESFAEVASPERISWLPQTVGWYWLGTIALFFALRYCWRALRCWYSNRYRREAYRRLQTLLLAPEQQDIIANTNEILKITAIVAYSRDRVAKLSGEHWVDFLNQQCEQPTFNDEQSTLLATCIYTQQNVGRNQHVQLIQAALNWVNCHRGRTHV